MMLLSGARNNLNSPIRLATGKKIPHHFNNNRDIYNIFMLTLRCNKFNTLSLILKVPSGRIRSAREWYHWIGLEKDINRHRILIF
jgi:hypothetical protein